MNSNVIHNFDKQCLTKSNRKLFLSERKEPLMHGAVKRVHTYHCKSITYFHYEKTTELHSLTMIPIYSRITTHEANWLKQPNLLFIMCTTFVLVKSTNFYLIFLINCRCWNYIFIVTSKM